MDTITAVIVDIVGSRKAKDRTAAQASVHAAFAAADESVPPRRTLWSTAGDEFQVIYPSLAAAAAATTLVLLSDEPVDVRFGIGEGESVTVSGSADDVPIYDGSAWWNARAAIERVHRTAGRSGTSRTWAVRDGDDPRDLNAALLLRDDLIGAMSARERRIARALIAGRVQGEIAATEGITQSAVSQSARRSGAGTLVRVQQLWTGADT
ncbi:SatD family protein [Microbacterium gorillae]|uniref:SatD family protein n=1 Tax=Microbacterium gorillae TaxID=1231063 RepID=UPI00058E7AB3|nr:SatD family protein [Microbacterium gorillae]